MRESLVLWRGRRRRRRRLAAGLAGVLLAGLLALRWLGPLRAALESAARLLEPGGRLCVIAFHSLEDRIVKQTFRTLQNPCICPPSFPVCVCGRKSLGRQLTGKPITAGPAELERNPRSRSATLRVFERGED